MTNSQRLAKVRAHLRRWLQINSSVNEDENDENTLGKIVSESILIRDGFYTGRTFEAVADSGHIRATWFMEPDELKVHDSTGRVVDVFQGDAICDEPLEVVAVTAEESAEEFSKPEQSEDNVAANSDHDSQPVSIPIRLLEYHPPIAEADVAAVSPNSADSPSSVECQSNQDDAMTPELRDDADDDEISKAA